MSKADRAVLCSTCDYWRPHVHYGVVGLCTRWGKMTHQDDYCQEWKPVDLRSQEYYWCYTCKMRVTREEAESHASRGHRVYKSAYVDPDVKEEIYEGF